MYIQGRGNSFYSGGARIIGKIRFWQFSKKLLHKSWILGGARPPQAPPGPPPLHIHIYTNVQNSEVNAWWNALAKSFNSCYDFLPKWKLLWPSQGKLSHGKLSRKTLSHGKLSWKTLSHGKLSQKTLSHRKLLGHRKIWVMEIFESFIHVQRGERGGVNWENFEIVT